MSSVARPTIPADRSDNHRAWPTSTLAAIAAADVVLFAYYVQATMIRQPFWDMYAHVMRYLQYRADGAWWSYLWAPHVQHRHVWIHLLTAFDAAAFSGVAYPLIAGATACQLVAAWLLWRESRRGIPGRVGQTVGWLVVMLVLTSVAAVDCAVPMDGIYPQALMFTVLAFVLFDGAGEHAPDRLVHWRRAAAIGAAIGAAFANTAALAIWPILCWAAWSGRAGRAWIAAVTIVGASFGVAYLYGLPLEPAGSADRAGVEQLLRMAVYLVTYMGLPWTRATALAVPGRLLGAMLFIGGVAVVFRRGIVRPPAGRLERLAVALILFSIATAVMAATGRVDVDADVMVPVRYSVFLVPLHVGVLWLVAPWLESLWRVGARRLALEVVSVAAGVLLLVQQVAAGQVAVRTTRSMRATIDRFVAGGDDDEMKRVVFDDLGQARRELTAIRGAGLYLNAR